MPRTHSLEKTRNIGIMAHIDAEEPRQPKEFFIIQEKSIE